MSNSATKPDFTSHDTGHLPGGASRSFIWVEWYIDKNNRRQAPDSIRVQGKLVLAQTQTFPYYKWSWKVYVNFIYLRISKYKPLKRQPLLEFHSIPLEVYTFIFLIHRYIFYATKMLHQKGNVNVLKCNHKCQSSGLNLNSGFKDKFRFF